MRSTLTRIVLISFLLVLFIPNLTFAETKTFIQEYTYQACAEDSKNSSRTIALMKVKRLLLEELGTYLESVAEVKEFNLTKDQITTLTAGVVQAEIIEEKWDTGTLEYWIKAGIKANSSDVIKSIDFLRKNHQTTGELENARKRSDDLLKETERLRKELATATGDKKQKDTEAYNKAIKELNAAEWFETGYQANLAAGWQEALGAFTKVIELNPQDAMAYFYRGVAYDSLGNYKQAITDYNKAIDLGPKLAIAHTNRGMAYHKLSNYKQAIADYDKVIELNPQDAMAYNNRGIAYDNLGNNKQAIADYNKAMELDPKDSMCFYNRGVSYHQLGNYKQAIADYDKAIELNPKDAIFYYNRGIAHDNLSNNKQAIADTKMAAILGLKEAQIFLRGKGINWTEDLAETTSSDEPALKPADKTEPSVPDDAAAKMASTDKNIASVNAPENQINTDTKGEVAAVVNKWANSWQSGDMESFRSCHAENFKSKNMNLNGWVSHKIDIRKRSKNINVRIDNLHITVDAGSAAASFTQYYSSSILKDKTSKKLELKKTDGEWKIFRETVLIVK